MMGEMVTFAEETIHPFNMKTNHAIQFGGCMLLTAVVAFLLQPIVLKSLFTEGMQDAFLEPSGYIGGLVYLLVYPIAAFILWPKNKAKSWKRLTLIYALVVNTAIILFIFIYPFTTPRETIGLNGGEIVRSEGLAWMLTLLSTLAAAVLSIFPIGMCCYLFKRKVDGVA